MKKTLCVSTLLCLAGQPLVAQERPNVIVFLVDDMGLMDTSLPFLTDEAGNPVRYPLNDWYQTPNMERMARQGIRFSTFYAQSVSSPSRASIMTGQNSTRHRTTNWINSETNNKTPFGPTDWNWKGISKNDVTLPRVLHEAGYKTIHVGKAHFGCQNSDGELPQNIGFDVNIAGSSIGHPGSYYGENGYGNIAILEGSWVGDKTTEAYEMCGYRELTEKYQVPFWDMQKDKGIERDCRGMKLNICERVANIDFLINVPVLKGHCQTKITCALKNMKGLIPNTEKRHFHAMGLHEPIAHLNVGLHQDFIVVDNICGDLDFEDGGNPVVMNRIWAGTDPVLIDSYVCQIMHYTTKDVPYIELAEKLGVGSTDLKNARIIYCEENARKELPKSRKVVELQDAVEEVESCSACYGYLIPALEMLKNDGLFEKLDTKICIGQGYRGKTGKLGVGACTCKFEHNVKGCPPTENQIYDFLKQYILGENK